ncbi:MAG: FecR domain-containing protein [Leptolyngbyaceae cyanobacterium RU_5_1]|nr:FecR domain-containing protein [Leptolyngbyaceae cyanobacterium RU_5_1]
MSNRVVLLTGLALVLLSVEGASQQSLPVRVNRWLAVQQTNGSVTYQHQNRLRSAKAGDRLQMVGDAVTTGQRSNTRLEVDTGIGFINVAENTKVTVRLLEFAADNGRITHLDILRGQVRLQLRRFTHRGSRLHIQTPAGVSAVRGTEFGVGVQPTGKTGVATLTGSVDTIAQGQTVAVSGGFQNFTIPGEAPSPPVPLNDNTELRYTLEKQIRAGIRRVRIKGQVDPVNMVFVGEKSQATDRNGQFSVVVPATSHQGLLITVVTPLGRQQTHYLVIKP